jgi:hypothetical protein
LTFEIVCDIEHGYYIFTVALPSVSIVMNNTYIHIQEGENIQRTPREIQ